jgi:hypothetical protein
MKSKKLIKNPVDDRIKPLKSDKEDEVPQVFQVAKRTNKKQTERRRFLKNMAGIAGMVTIADILTGCDSDYSITSNASQCTCHVVCTCDTESLEGDDSQWEAEYSGGVCTCNTVCTCDTVCTCNTEGGSSCSSCGYWYPN